MAPRKQQLSVRFDPELLEQLELVANREHRPIANQVVHFVAKGIESYLGSQNLHFQKSDDGLTLESFPEPAPDWRNSV